MEGARVCSGSAFCLYIVYFRLKNIFQQTKTMIKLFSLKQQKKDGIDSSDRGSQKKASAAQLRIQKGVVLSTEIKLK